MPPQRTVSSRGPKTGAVTDRVEAYAVRDCLCFEQAPRPPEACVTARHNLTATELISGASALSAARAGSGRYEAIEIIRAFDGVCAHITSCPPAVCLLHIQSNAGSAGHALRGTTLTALA